MDPWKALARDRGVTIRVVKMCPETGLLDWTDLESAVGTRTKLLAIGAASNALGTISDVKRACALARAAGSLSFVDAVHYAPHNLVDVKALDCDFLGCSAYKFYGPHVGVIYGRQRLLEALDVPKLEPAPDEAPDRMETGRQNHEGIIGAAAAVDFLASPGQGATRRARLASALAMLHERGQELFTRLWDGLGALPGVTRYGPGPDPPRKPTIAFTVPSIQ